jgi:hypothetical protein
MSQFDWPITQKKKKKPWRLPRIEGSILKCRVPALWLTYIGERRQHLPNHGIKVRCYGEHVGGTHWDLGEHIENLMGTHGELKGNMLGTNWELGKNETKSLPPPNLKGKKARHLQCMLQSSHWLHEISLPK